MEDSCQQREVYNTQTILIVIYAVWYSRKQFYFISFHWNSQIWFILLSLDIFLDKNIEFSFKNQNFEIHLNF